MGREAIPGLIRPATLVRLNSELVAQRKRLRGTRPLFTTYEDLAGAVAQLGVEIGLAMSHEKGRYRVETAGLRVAALAVRIIEAAGAAAPEVQS